MNAKNMSSQKSDLLCTSLLHTKLITEIRMFVRPVAFFQCVASADVNTPNRTARQHLSMHGRESDSGVPDRAFEAQIFVKFMPTLIVRMAVLRQYSSRAEEETRSECRSVGRLSNGGGNADAVDLTPLVPQNHKKTLWFSIYDKAITVFERLTLFLRKLSYNSVTVQYFLCNEAVVAKDNPPRFEGDTTNLCFIGSLFVQHKKHPPSQNTPKRPIFHASYIFMLYVSTTMLK
ncbi:hypothetical protein EGR_10132 [Echinococcus granulosus]|uniref:Uncharacterized protein n=1 Tax=Echinococcus granulosus TaxID=6210 RepID=W6UNS5_ECHGR|nr:hypothetical protein EGR_10132 [Echinococcus granulosus]EUB55014.1 hypothetical protein EGR_10132 [Echinococcus granulosus]